jgi:sulfate adenylyltransferase
LEKIGLGAFSPLANFMNETEFHSVCENMYLPSGEAFTIPVVLDVDADIAKRARNTSKIDLIYSSEKVGEIVPESVFTCDKDAICKHVYATNDRRHPGVQRFFNSGGWFIGGKTTLTSRVALKTSKYELTPEETRAKFKSLGWKTIVGFQTRNVPHRAHEYLQRVALEHVDGLFIQPLIGQKKNGDYTPEAIMAGYSKLVEGFYPVNRVVLGVLSTSMRYAGPREAVFHALIRKNYGCTHFIVGRDHAGVGNYYGKYAAHELLRRFEGKLGIRIMYLHGPYHCDICGGIVTEHTCPHSLSDPASTTEISGTLIRKVLSGGERPDERFFRPEVLGALQNISLFVEDQ